MKIFLIFFILFFFNNSFAQELIEEAHITLNIPKDTWELYEKNNYENKILYAYKRKPVYNKDSIRIIPNIALIIEAVDPMMDVVNFSGIKRFLRQFNIEETFTHEDPRISFESCIAYKGNYEDERQLHHTVYIVHAVYKNKGVQIIMDSTTDVFHLVEDEFIAVMQSIKEIK